MKKAIIFTFLFFLAFGDAMAANARRTTTAATPAAPVTANQQTTEEINKLIELENKMVNNFKIFLDELRQERSLVRQENQAMVNEMKKMVNDINSLVNESRKEIKQMTFKETRNILIATIFLWVSITIFVVMNILFANAIKKELFYLRNGLLRDEIKDNMNSLSEQLKSLNERLDAINKG